jgi:hypothetical protein
MWVLWMWLGIDEDLFDTVVMVCFSHFLTKRHGNAAKCLPTNRPARGNTPI